MPEDTSLKYELSTPAASGPVRMRVGRMPAFSSPPGALTWGQRVYALLAAPNGSPLVAGGRFQYLEVVAWSVDAEAADPSAPVPPVQRVLVDGGVGPMMRARGIPVEVVPDREQLLLDQPEQPDGRPPFRAQDDPVQQRGARPPRGAQCDSGPGPKRGGAA